MKLRGLSGVMKLEVPKTAFGGHMGCQFVAWSCHQMRSYVLSDNQWKRIEHLLSSKASDACVTARDNRLFVEAILHCFRAGIPWRDFPERTDNFRIIFSRCHSVRPASHPV